MLGFILTLLIALIFAYIANIIVKGDMPGGTSVTFIIGVLGAWLGYTKLLGYGQTYDKLNIITSILGAFTFVLLYGLFRKVISEIKIWWFSDKIILISIILSLNFFI